MILGGDLNVALDPLLAVSKSASHLSYQYLGYKKALQTVRLVDIWRVQHPAERDYTFYSVPHDSYSQIDYVLVSQSLISAVVNYSIGIKVVSDHAPAFIDLQLVKSINRPWSWKLKVGFHPKKDKILKSAATNTVAVDFK